MEQFDLFHFYRFLLACVVGIYCLVNTSLFVWRWAGYGTDGSSGITLLRRYVVVLLLRTPLSRFLYEFLVIGGLTAILALLLHLH